MPEFCHYPLEFPALYWDSCHCLIHFYISNYAIFTHTYTLWGIKAIIIITTIHYEYFEALCFENIYFTVSDHD